MWQTRILYSKVLLSGSVNFCWILFYYNDNTISEDKFGLKKATGLREGAVQDVVLVSD